MGKEQELLDAARTGNITVVEKILSNRVKKAGPLAPLARLVFDSSCFGKYDRN